MAEKRIVDRVFFPMGKQNKFLNDVQHKLLLDNKELARLAGKSIRTLADWRKEKFSMTLDATKTFSQRSGIAIPASVKIKEAYWYVSLGASAGGRAVYKKYGHIGGDEEARKKKWRTWWEAEGKFAEHPMLNITKSIRKPLFTSDLAEFVGIILGDGGITKRQVTVTLHRHDDKEYSEYVRHLFENLFCVIPGTYKNKRSLADSIVISRVELVQFCVNKLGLKIGNKVRQQVGVPEWVISKKAYRIACLRGLVDTDGCIIRHKYTVKGKQYCYKKLSFTNSSMPLLQFVFNEFKALGMNPRITKNGKEVRLENLSDMELYFHAVGSNNPKHLNRWSN